MWHFGWSKWFSASADLQNMFRAVLWECKSPLMYLHLPSSLLVKCPSLTHISSGFVIFRSVCRCTLAEALKDIDRKIPQRLWSSTWAGWRENAWHDIYVPVKAFLSLKMEERFYLPELRSGVMNKQEFCAPGAAVLQEARLLVRTLWYTTTISGTENSCNTTPGKTY